MVMMMQSPSVCSTLYKLPVHTVCSFILDTSPIFRQLALSVALSTSLPGMLEPLH